MIFNPYDIPAFPSPLHTTAEALSWAPVLLQDNMGIVLLVLLFIIADLLAWHPNGVMAHQLEWLANTRNARTFEASAVIYSWLKPMLLSQYFVFFSLSCLHVIDPDMAQLLYTLHPESWPLLLACLLIPLGWFLLQKFLFTWFCYLFGINDRQIIMSRCYTAVHIMLAPLATVVFISVLAGSFSPQTTFILLATLFILSQIAFVFNGFKIFCTNFYAFFILIVYLCTLEIAPLLVFYAKIGA